MLQTLTKSEIESRVKAINRSPAWLAKAANIDRMTVYRGPRRVDTHNRVVAALETEEIRLRDHLLKVHGLPDNMPADVLPNPIARRAG